LKQTGKLSHRQIGIRADEIKVEINFFHKRRRPKLSLYYGKDLRGINLLKIHVRFVLRKDLSFLVGRNPLIKFAAAQGTVMVRIQLVKNSGGNLPLAGRNLPILIQVQGRKDIPLRRSRGELPTNQGAAGTTQLGQASQHSRLQ